MARRIILLLVGIVIFLQRDVVRKKVKILKLWYVLEKIHQKKKYSIHQKDSSSCHKHMIAGHFANLLVCVSVQVLVKKPAKSRHLFST